MKYHQRRTETEAVRAGAVASLHRYDPTMLADWIQNAYKRGQIHIGISSITLIRPSGEGVALDPMDWLLMDDAGVRALDADSFIRQYEPMTWPDKIEAPKRVPSCPRVSDGLPYGHPAPADLVLADHLDGIV